MNFREWYLFESRMEVQALRILDNDQNSGIIAILGRHQRQEDKDEL